MNLQIYVAPKTRLGQRIAATSYAFSEDDGFRQVKYRGSIRLGVDVSGRSLRLRSVVVRQPLEGRAGRRRKLVIRLAADQVARVRAAGARAGRRSVVMSVRVSGKAAGRRDRSVVEGSYRLRL